MLLCDFYSIQLGQKVKSWKRNLLIFAQCYLNLYYCVTQPSLDLTRNKFLIDYFLSSFFCHNSFISTATVFAPIIRSDCFGPLHFFLRARNSHGVARSKYVGWADMANAERQPITGVWRRSDPTHTYHRYHRPPTPPLVKTRWICINFRSDL